MPFTRATRTYAPAVRATLSYDPNAPTFGGLLGKWSIACFDAAGVEVGNMLAGHQQCLDHAKKHGVKRSKIEYDDAAKREAWRAFRARYSRR